MLRASPTQPTAKRARVAAAPFQMPPERKNRKSEKEETRGRKKALKITKVVGLMEGEQTVRYIYRDEDEKLGVAKSDELSDYNLSHVIQFLRKLHEDDAVANRPTDLVKEMEEHNERYRNGNSEEAGLSLIDETEEPIYKRPLKKGKPMINVGRFFGFMITGGDRVKWFFYSTSGNKEVANEYQLGERKGVNYGKLLQYCESLYGDNISEACKKVVDKKPPKISNIVTHRMPNQRMIYLVKFEGCQHQIWQREYTSSDLENKDLVRLKNYNALCGIPQRISEQRAAVNESELDRQLGDFPRAIQSDQPVVDEMDDNMNMNDFLPHDDMSHALENNRQETDGNDFEVTPDREAILMEMFEKHHWLNTGELADMVERTGLEKEQVMEWFKRQRKSVKKEEMVIKEELEDEME